MKQKGLRNIILLVGTLLLINIISANFFTRFDLTEDQRYTLSEESQEILSSAKAPVFITVYLKGNFPSAYKRLQREVRYLLEEFTTLSAEVKFEFVNPVQEGDNAQKMGEKFAHSGMPPVNLNTYQNGKVTEQLIFPWAVAQYKNRQVKIPLLQKNFGQKTEQIINNSVAQLEYVFADAFHKLIAEKTKTIAVMRGNGELLDRNLQSFIRGAQKYYIFAPFTLDSVGDDPQETLKNLKKYDLIIEARPTEKFTEKEKYVLDQYLMSGGKMLWMMEAVKFYRDSLFNSPNNTTLAMPELLNLTDFFFKYGVRINPSFVKDMRSAPLVLVRGRGKQRHLSPQPWFYKPLVRPKSDHPIVKGLKSIRFMYASPMDTLANNIEKTVLLKSSKRTKIVGTPRQINLSDIHEKPNFKTFDDGSQPLAVLLEGKFPSLYQNRVKPFDYDQNRNRSKPTKMIVISDGEVIKNKVSRGKPVPLGKDRYSGKVYGNKKFLINSLNYLLGDEELLALRSKEVKLPFLDSQKVAATSLKWKLINLLVPLILLGGFGFLFTWIRRRKYT